MQDFRNLKVWQKAHMLALDVHRVTASFPREEAFSLTSQMRRSAVSIGSNIAEGCGRGSDADLRRMLQIALRSASELEYQLLLAHDLSLLDSLQHSAMHSQVAEIKRMLSALIARLNNARRGARAGEGLIADS